VIRFDIFDQNPLDGEAHIVAQLPWYATIPDGRRPTISATSKLARLLDLLGPGDPRRLARRSDRVPLGALRHRLWRVEIADVVADRDQHPLHPVQRYSIVRAVLEHVA
jgi:hypothetical protein